MKKVKKALKFLLGFIALIVYELFLDESGIGMKQRWKSERMKEKKRIVIGCSIVAAIGFGIVSLKQTMLRKQEENL